MSFYNPYMKTPDWGQGVSDFKNKALMVLMAMMSGGMIPGMEGGAGGNPMAALGATQAGANMSNIPPPQGMGQQILSGVPTGMPPTGGPPPASSPKVGVEAAMPQIDPQMMQMLMQMLMQGMPPSGGLGGSPMQQFGR